MPKHVNGIYNDTFPVHVNRGGGSNRGHNVRGVAFKHSRQGKRDIGTEWSACIQAHFEEENIYKRPIVYTTYKGFTNKKQGGPSGSPPSVAASNKQKLLNGSTGCFPIHDGIHLPAPTEVAHLSVPTEDAQLTAQQTFLCNSKGKEVVRDFLKKYFLIFDSDSRQPLLKFYHEHAVFSTTMCYVYYQRLKKARSLKWYENHNRNIMVLRKPKVRHKYLQQGQLAIVSFLSEMPASKHDIHSFTVDLTLFTPQMLLLTVTGMFWELRTFHATPPLRHFCRTLFLVPSESGFCIANELLHITNATIEQEKVAMKAPVGLPEVTRSAKCVTGSSVIPAPSTSLPDDLVKRQLVYTMSYQSGKDLRWSQKCLEETRWDFDRAVLVFKEYERQADAK